MILAMHYHAPSNSVDGDPPEQPTDVKLFVVGALCFIAGVLVKAALSK